MSNISMSSDMQTQNRQLDETQLVGFLHQKGISERISLFFKSQVERFETPVRNILDCGGGNGMYLDLLLECFPQAEGTLLDSAQFMLDQNIQHPRKKLRLDNIENLLSLGQNGERFDLICFHDVLHHCVTDTYSSTRELQTKILRDATELLSPQGRIMITERIMDSWVRNDFSVRCIYSLTKSKFLSLLMRKAGANTAGVGVCFLSKKKMYELADVAGLRPAETNGNGEFTIVSYCNDFSFKMLPRQLFLGLSSIAHTGFMFARK